VAWREFLAGLNRDVTLPPGSSNAQLLYAETQLGVLIPEELHAFLAETDGLFDNDAQHWYGWPLERIVSENLSAWRDEELLLDNALLAFGDDGTGDCFCLEVDERTPHVFHWSWIDGEARPIATDLRSFWSGWLTGELTVSSQQPRGVEQLELRRRASEDRLRDELAAEQAEHVAVAGVAAREPRSFLARDPTHDR
jgi:hypothetical protein